MSETHEFLRALYSDTDRGYLAIWSVRDERHKKTDWYSVDKLDNAADKSILLSKDVNVYFGIGLQSQDLGPFKRGRAKDVIAVPGVWLDIDVSGPAHKAANLPPTIEAAMDLAAEFPLKPTVVIHSGHGLQGWWLFREPWMIDSDEERQKARSLSEGFQREMLKYAATRGWKLDKTSDLSRILRLPGTWNRKLKPVQVSVMKQDLSLRYEPNEFEKLLADTTVRQNPPEPKAAETQRELKPAQWEPIVEGCTWIRHCRDDAATLPEPEWYGMLSIAGRCQNHERLVHELSRPHPGYSKDETRRKLRQALQQAGPRTCADIRHSLNGESYCTACPHWGRLKSPIVLGDSGNPSRRHTETIRRVGAYAAISDSAWVPSGPRETGPTATSTSISGRAPNCTPAPVSRTGLAGDESGIKQKHQRLAAIKANNRELRDVTNDALEALRAANNPPFLFVRGGALTRIREDENHRPFIESLGEPPLRGLLTRTADYYRDTETGRKKSFPPKDVVHDLMGLGSWPFPALEGITETPVIRPDGSIVVKPGYDPATKLIYVPAPGLVVPPIPDRPTRQDLERALDIIQDAICDFPFADDASKANAFALMLTPLLRPLTRSKAPLALIEAPQQGTGKSLLAQLVAVAATGSQKPMTAMPENEEEMAKAVLAMLRAGTQMIIFDNVDSKIDSSKLALTLTSDEYEARILGTNDQGRYPQRATWIVTGNNIRLGGDIRRRCYSIRLDARTSRPYQRDGFKRPDLIAWAMANRGSLNSALLTIIRAWVVAGRPEAKVPVVGSFETWANATGSILAHADITGFLENSQSLDESDEDAPQWESFLKTLHAEFSSGAFTTHEVAEKGRLNSSITETLPDDLADQINRPGGSFQKKLGQALRKHEKARFGEEGYYVERAGADRKGSIRWVVKKGKSD